MNTGTLAVGAPGYLRSGGIRVSEGEWGVSGSGVVLCPQRNDSSATTPKHVPATAAFATGMPPSALERRP